MSDNEQAQFDDAADALLRSLWPEFTAVGAMVFDAGALELRAVGDGTVQAVIYPAADDVEFDEETGAELPSQVLTMSPTQARVLAAMFSHAADHVEQATGNNGFGYEPEICLGPADE